MRIVPSLLVTLAASALLAGLASAAPALDAAGKCRDIATKKFTKCGAPNSEPVPSAPAASAPK